MEKKLKVKLYGEAFKIHRLEINPSFLPKFIKAGGVFKEPLHKAILNVDYFNVLNISRFKTLNDVIKYTFSGLINNDKNQIEINYSRKLLVKFQLEKLFRQQTLFPLYKTKIAHVTSEKLLPGIYIEEIEIGLIGTYEIDIINFQVELLEFHLADLKVQNLSYELLGCMYYENRKLALEKSDTLLRSQNSFEIL